MEHNRQTGKPVKKRKVPILDRGRARSCVPLRGTKVPGFVRPKSRSWEEMTCSFQMSAAPCFRSAISSKQTAFGKCLWLPVIQAAPPEVTRTPIRIADWQPIDLCSQFGTPGSVEDQSNMSVNCGTMINNPRTNSMTSTNGMVPLKMSPSVMLGSASVLFMT